MILYPVTKLEIETNLTPWEVETTFRNEMGRKRFNWYDGEVKHSKFELWFQIINSN